MARQQQRKVASIVDMPWHKIEILFDGTYLIRSWELMQDGTSRVLEIRLLREDSEGVIAALRKHLDSEPHKQYYEEVLESQVCSAEAKAEITRRLDWNEFYNW